MIKRLPGNYLYRCKKCESIYGSDMDVKHFKPFKCYKCNRYLNSEDVLWFDLGEVKIKGAKIND